MIILLFMTFTFKSLNSSVTAPYFIYFSSLFKKCMKIKIIHRPLTPTFVSIVEKMIFHFHLKKMNKMFPNVFYCYTAHTLTHILTWKHTIVHIQFFLHCFGFFNRSKFYSNSMNVLLIVFT